MTQNKSSFFGKLWGNIVLRNIAIAIGAAVAMLIVVMILLGLITRHGKELSVPDFSNMALADATALANSKSLRLQVVDSVFVKRMTPGAVYSQNPAASSKVKKNRRIFVVTNATVSQTVEMPSLIGLSLRQAKTEILSKGLQLGKLTYQRDIATNNVLNQLRNGKSIPSGTKIETDSEIDLLLGLSEADSTTYIPHLIGLSLQVAKDNIFDNSLNVGKVRFDETVLNYEDSIAAQVYMQSPAFTNSAPFILGTKVDITLTKDPLKVSSAQKVLQNTVTTEDE